MIDPALEQAAVRELGRFARQARESSEMGAALTAREREILDLLADGRSNGEIAKSLFISPKTVRNNLSSVYAKLQVADRTQAILRARDAGLGHPY